MIKMTWTLPVFCLALGLAAQEPDVKKARQEKMAALRKALASAVEGERVTALRGLGESTDDEAIPLLAGKLATDTDGIRVAAAHALSNHRRPASLKAIANAIAPNVTRPEVLKAFIEALQELDLCGCLPVLMALAEINRNALGQEALKAVGKIDCSESVALLVSMLQRAELEEKKPDVFEGTDDVPESENKQKNKALAALVPMLRDLLAAVTGKSLTTSKEWTAALEAGKVNLKRTSVYLCLLKETTFEVPSGQPKKCPYHDGKTAHEDVFLKHLRE